MPAHTNQILPEIQFADFIKIDIRVGTIISAKPNPKAKKPAYILEIDFGNLGIKKSSAQLVDTYSVDELINKQILAVINFPIKKVAGIKSEVLVLAAIDSTTKQETILIQPQKKVPNGSHIA